MSSAGSGLPEVTVAVVASVVQHRALSTEQVRRLHFPTAGARWVQVVMGRIEAAGYLSHTVVRRSPRRLWFATDSGVELATADGALAEKPRLFTAAEISGRLWAHTHVVNEVAISFLGAARERGDDFGPLSWRHEVLHQIGPKGAPGRRRLVTDAVLTYIRGTASGEVFLEQRFLEVDRATRSIEGTAGALAAYARLATFDQEQGRGWRALYPSLPPVICVLAGADEKTLARRRTTILALLRARPELTRAEEVRISICLADELEREGPFAPIFGELREPGTRVDWLGRGPGC